MALKEQGASGFQSNCRMDHASDDKFTCDLCGPDIMACRRCLVCEENYCEPCSHAHEKSKASKQHKIGELGNLNPKTRGKIRQRIFCEKHSEDEVKFVCQKCNVLTCGTCYVLEHNTHKLTTATDAATELQKKLEEKLRLCLEKLKRLRDTATEEEMLMKKISNTKLEELKALDEHYANLEKSLKHEVENLKEKIQRIYNELINERTAFKKGVENEIKACCDANEKANTLINQGTDIEKFKQVPDLEQIFDKIILKSDPKMMPCLQKKLFSPAALKNIELSSLIGIVQDCTRLNPEEEERLKKETDEMIKEEEIYCRRKEEEGRRKEEEGRRKEEEGRRKEEEGRRKEEEGRRKEEEGRRKEEEGRRKDEEGRRKDEEGRRKDEEGRRKAKLEETAKQEDLAKLEEKRGKEDRESSDQATFVSHVVKDDF